MSLFFFLRLLREASSTSNHILASGYVLTLSPSYKPKGSTKADSKGNPDSNEFYTVTRLGVTSEPDPLMPTQVSDEKEMLASFMYHAHEVTIRVLTQVESFLHLAPGTLENLHAQDKASSSQTRVIKYHPQPDPDKTATFPSHTDLGSLTILFTHLGGLQVIPPNTEDIPANWKYVKPRDGCAIVNIGDTMTKYTNGLFTSPRHRVTYPPGEQASQYRYSIAYFARPDHQAPMQRLESDAIPPLKEGEVQDNLTVRKWYFNEFVRRQNIHDKL